MLRILRHLAYEAPHHLTTPNHTDRCERPAGHAADSTPAPPTDPRTEDDGTKPPSWFPSRPADNDMGRW